MKVAIVGHSFIRRLEEYSRDTRQSVHPEHDMSFHGKSGSKVENLFGLIKELPEGTKMVFIQTGGNDINPTTCPTSIAKKMLKFAEEIVRERDIPVIVGTVFIRTKPRYQTALAYDKHRKQVNDNLKRLMKHKSKIRVAGHERFFRKLEFSYLLDDGVHLNALGQMAFLLYIRRAINKAMMMHHQLFGPHSPILPKIVNKEYYKCMNQLQEYSSSQQPFKRRQTS